MKSIYLESSVVSYLAARPSRDLVVAGNQQVTRDWWETRRGECELFVSEVVVEECAAGDPTAASERRVFLAGLSVLTTTEEAEALADALLSAMALPQKAALDALHIGLAAASGIDILLTWNCAHIANPFIMPQINAACVEFGVIPPIICTPIATYRGIGRCGKTQLSKKLGAGARSLLDASTMTSRPSGEELRRRHKARGQKPITRPPKRVKPTAA